MSRSLYALHDLPKNPDGRTPDGHRFLNVCHTKAPKGATRLQRVAPLGTLVWKTFDVNLTWIMIFHLQKVGYFCFYTVHMDPLVKNPDFWVIYTSQNVFYFFFRKT